MAKAFTRRLNEHEDVEGQVDEEEGQTAVTITRVPDVAVTTITRFSVGKDGNTTKVNMAVKVQEAHIFTETHDGSEVPVSMETCGIICHKGERKDAGHYTAYCKDDEEQWRCFDDNKVTLCTDFKKIQDDVASDVYMVFFRRNTQSIRPYPDPEKYYVFWWHQDGMRLFWTEDGQAGGTVRTTTSVLGGVTTFLDYAGYAILQMYMHDGKGGPVTRVLLKYNGLLCNSHGSTKPWVKEDVYKKKNPIGFAMYSKFTRTDQKHIDALNAMLRKECADTAFTGT
jgi:hypothetical protein